MKLKKCSLLAVALFMGGTWVRGAHAQEVVATPAPTQTTSETVTQRGGPSRAMLSGGILTLGVTYGAGAIVAATSDRDSDHRLFVPIAGPWMALFDRGDCGGTTGRSCDLETTYKVLIVADGIGQALGATMIIGAFLSPETNTTTRSTTALSKPTFHVSPTPMGAGGYGMLAAGTF
jgi:hypothetical protein